MITYLYNKIKNIKKEWKQKKCNHEFEEEKFFIENCFYFDLSCKKCSVTINSFSGKVGKNGKLFNVK